MTRDIFVVTRGVGGGSTGIQCVEASNAAKHSTMLRTIPDVKNNLALNVNSAEPEKPCVNSPYDTWKCRSSEVGIRIFKKFKNFFIKKVSIFLIGKAFFKNQKVLNDLQ